MDTRSFRRVSAESAAERQSRKNLKVQAPPRAGIRPGRQARVPEPRFAVVEMDRIDLEGEQSEEQPVEGIRAADRVAYHALSIQANFHVGDLSRTVCCLKCSAAAKPQAPRRWCFPIWRATNRERISNRAIA